MAEAMSPDLPKVTLSNPIEPRQALTPPTSEEWNKHDDNTSELSEPDEDEDDIGEVEPAYYYEGGRVPVFTPTMEQFKDFKQYIDKIDKYGMKSGIVKVIPPKEWRASLPDLDEAVKKIVVKNPITQEISTSGSHGTFTVANIEKMRSYNLPQWKDLTEEMQHQPPARRGEKRKKQEKQKPAPRAAAASTAAKPAAFKRRGRSTLPSIETDIPEEDVPQAPLTPTSPGPEPKTAGRAKRGSAATKKEAPAPVAKKPRGRPPKGTKADVAKSVSSRRMHNQRDDIVTVDEADFEDFDYRFDGNEEFTAERCQELETLYWKSLTYAPPIYGADMPGSLFDERTEVWNVAELPNLLDVIGAKVPGVNTAYLYLGMWKASFAWHLEDVDLYSINYIHFGAPKQWYSISQEDARKFEKAMQSIWPDDAKHCSQFLRHKTYLISPQVLQSQFNIKVNKLVHNEGEFVITYPYGYHSGYNLGYNCAESVNFANEAWLEYGKIAKKCDCESDSVWINVEDIERKLRGEPTPEYYEVTDDDDEMDEDDDSHISKLPTPPASVKAKASRKRKREADKAPEKPARPVKKIKIRIKTSNVEPCVLCPNNLPSEPLLQTDTGRHAHRVCALYTPETYLSDEVGQDRIMGVAGIDKARLDLKCSFCRSKKGACFQCSSKKCTRAYHATCAMAAGVQVEYGPTPVYGEDGTEYISEAYDFRCRIHRSKRNRHETIEKLESNLFIRRFAKTLLPKDTIQMQHLGGDIFAGTVVENRIHERNVLVDILPDGDRVEVDWKYILALEPHHSQLPKPSATAIALPASMTSKVVSIQSGEYGPPQPGQDFTDGNSINKWCEFSLGVLPRNPNQVKVDINKDLQLWHYLGRNSTDARAQYTENVNIPRHNPAGGFLEIQKAGQMAELIRKQAQELPPRLMKQSTPTPRARSKTPGRSSYAPPYAPNNSNDYRPHINRPKMEPFSPQVRAPLNTPSTGIYTKDGTFKPMPALARPLGTTAGATPFQFGSQLPGVPNYPRRPSMDVSVQNRDFDRRRSSTMNYDAYGSRIIPAPSPMQRDLLADSQKLARINGRPSAGTVHRTTADISMPNLLNMSSLSSSESPVIRAASKDLEFVTNIQPYKYLLNSYCRRSKIYETPYPGQNGFSPEYQKLIAKNEPNSNQTSPHYQEIVPPSLYPIVPPTESRSLGDYGMPSNGLPPMSTLQSPWGNNSNSGAVLPQPQQHSQHSQQSYYNPQPLPPPSRTSAPYYPSYQYQTPAQFSQQLRQSQETVAAPVYDMSYDRLFSQMKNNTANVHDQQSQQQQQQQQRSLDQSQVQRSAISAAPASLRNLLNEDDSTRPGATTMGWR